MGDPKEQTDDQAINCFFAGITTCKCAHEAGGPREHTGDQASVVPSQDPIYQLRFHDDCLIGPTQLKNRKANKHMKK